MVTGRFAPTPSGRMHLGNVFSALLAWLSARSQGGRLVMRVEDLDTLRTSPAHTEAILRDLDWLGLDWDDGPGAVGLPASAAAMKAGQRAGAQDGYIQSIFTPEGPCRNWFQSARTPFYKEMLAKLAAGGLVYPCWCSRAQLHAGGGAGAPPDEWAATSPRDAARQAPKVQQIPLALGLATAKPTELPDAWVANAPHASDGSYIYGGRCRENPTEAERAANGRPPALRARVPNEVVSFVDACQGPYAQNLARECGDFILQRSDGVFAYQLAATADDGAMGITEVVRGRDLLSSTPRQIWLLRMLGFAPPRYCHLPLLLAPDGRRLAKRDADLDLGAIRARQPDPRPLLGVLAHLAGLLPAPQPVTAAQLLPLFSWAKVPKDDLLLDASFLAH